MSQPQIQIPLDLPNVRVENYQQTDKGLAAERAKRQDGTSKYDEFIESYKHLREHGNAFFILLMELVLALVLFSVEKTHIALLMALLWIAPACFVWFLGTYLELSIHKLEENA